MNYLDIVARVFLFLDGEDRNSLYKTCKNYYDNLESCILPMDHAMWVRKHPGEDSSEILIYRGGNEDWPFKLYNALGIKFDNRLYPMHPRSFEVPVSLKTSQTIICDELSQFAGCQHISDRFLCESTALTSVDFQHLSSIRSIGDFFLYDCMSLFELDLMPFSRVTRIGERFLGSCKNLKTVKFDFSKLREIPNYFMLQCNQLVSIDLESCRNVIKIESGFLGSCQTLTSIDLAPLSNVRRVGAYFLCNCTSILHINLDPLDKLDVIEEGFLYGCRALDTLTYRTLSLSVRIEKLLLHNCYALSRVELGRDIILRVHGHYILNRNKILHTPVGLGEAIVSMRRQMSP